MVTFLTRWSERCYHTKWVWDAGINEVIGKAGQSVAGQLERCETVIRATQRERYSGNATNPLIAPIYESIITASGFHIKRTAHFEPRFAIQKHETPVFQTRRRSESIPRSLLFQIVRPINSGKKSGGERILLQINRLIERWKIIATHREYPPR